ncbi:LacI family DNA-binding transcriptional regulator [Actinomadura hibisca]|uniref:LacI family DNA-binding transcriptional regulator n=1 Tax=Actinomadura hibisca TaxID=68565 RepID=UPI00083757A9|nr:LacI family DNA-binding transcriptional regulator [Actinomadura hibisca]
MDEQSGGAPATPTIADVARLAGVSKGAVSLALNDKPGVSEETRQRIREAAETLNWRPSIHARAMLRSRAFAVGLVLARDPRHLALDPFFAGFLGGVQTVLADSNSVLVLQVVGQGEEAEAEGYRRLARERRIDGAFLLDVRTDDRRPALLRELGLAAVAVGPDGADYDGTPFVGVRDGDGIRDAVEHLAGLGHRRIAFVEGAPAYLHSASRLAAWRDAMRAHGLPAGPHAAGHFTGEGGAAATRLLLERRPTAIVYASDLMAIAGMSVAREAGLDVPADLSLTGFDDNPEAAHLHPPLTTVRQDPVAVGAAAAELLMARIDGRRVTPVSPSPRLIVRGSTAAPPAAR